MTSTAIPATATAVQESVREVPTSFQHPLDPLTPDEILAVSQAVREHISATQPAIQSIKFITCYLLPPPKRQVLAFLGIPLTPGGQPELPTPITRRAEVDFLDVGNGVNYNVILHLDHGSWHASTFAALPDGVQPQISVEELIDCERVVRNDKQVQQLAKDVGILPEQIVCDGWSIGYDERFPQKRRVQQALTFARLSEHENLYAHPLDFIPVIDANTDEVLHFDYAPHYKNSPDGPVLSNGTGSIPALSEDSLRASGRERIPPPTRSFDFLPDLTEKNEPNFKLRNDLKPLHIIQPEGTSFTMRGHELEWQNWKMHIAFSHREGIALSTITYNDNGQVRPLIYRISLAEMVVPYAAPEFPHPRKFAFDSGEYGMGTMANELSLGCDCLGQIHYLPGAFIGHNGTPIIIKNVICIHEEDNGVLWKHTDYRPGGRSRTVRRRRLVVSMVCTLANYEYIWNYFFYQDGGLEFEIRLTGILQVYVADKDEPSKYGTFVAPGINAHYHQHLFSLRLDPMVDGLKNSVVETDIVPLPDAPTGSQMNLAGNAFIVNDTVLKQETGRPYELSTERRWRIVNPSKQHYSTKKDVGYVLGLKGGISPLMARPDSWVAQRASFTKYPIWICRDVEGEKGSERMWPSGKYVPQTRGAPKDCVSAWVDGQQNVEDEDIIVYVTIGTTHIPAPEHWPVLSVETLNVTFKPQSFFEKNPSMDVPGTHDARSIPAFGSGSSSSSACH